MKSTKPYKFKYYFIPVISSIYTKYQDLIDKQNKEIQKRHKFALSLGGQGTVKMGEMFLGIHFVNEPSNKEWDKNVFTGLNGSKTPFWLPKNKEDKEKIIAPLKIDSVYMQKELFKCTDIYFLIIRRKGVGLYIECMSKLQNAQAISKEDMKKVMIEMREEENGK